MRIKYDRVEKYYWDTWLQQVAVCYILKTAACAKNSDANVQQEKLYDNGQLNTDRIYLSSNIDDRIGDTFLWKP